MSSFRSKNSKGGSSSSDRSISPMKYPSSGGNHQTLHHANNSFASQNTAGRNQQWLDETVQQRLVKLIPYEEFEDERIEEKGDKEQGSGGINNSIKTLNWKKMKKRVVVKELENVNDLSDETREAFVSELKLHLRVDFDEKIIRISGLSQETENNSYIVVMQYADGGNLQEYLTKNFKRMTWVDKGTLAKQIAEGVEFLHRNGILHGNLHSRNVLFHQSHPKLTDFGTCTHLVSSSQAYAHNEPRYIPYIDPQYLYHPTIYTKDTRSDTYSLGIILWEISSGRVPFSSYSGPSADELKLSAQEVNEESSEKTVGGKAKSIRSMDTRERAEELTNRIIRGVREQAVRDTPNAYYGLYNKCWQSNPTVRPTSEEVVKELERLLEGGLMTVTGSRGVAEMWAMGGESRLGEERFSVMPKRSRTSEIDLAELRNDALAAELWLHYQDVADKTGKSFSVGDFGSHDDNEESEMTTEENMQNEADQTQYKPPETTINYQPQHDTNYNHPTSKKWKNKAKSLVKRLSGRHSRSQRVHGEVESVNNSEGTSCSIS